MTRRRNQGKPTGQAGPHGRTNGSGAPDQVGVNGHAPASSERGGVPGQRDRAASVDARRASAAMDASSIIAPGTDCAGYAEVAPLRPNGERHEADGNQPDPKTKTKPKTRTKKIPGGEFPLPDNPGDFVEEIHRRTDLFEVWQKLLNHADPKIQQRAVEKLTEMRYKGAAALADEPQQIVIDIPRPKRD